jgi:serine/threonine protein kinase
LIIMDVSQTNRLGIWRLGPALHTGALYRVVRAQPLDARGSPRWDYAIKFGDSAPARAGIAHSISAAADVRHPNLVSVVDGDAQGRMPYLVMPLLSGHNMQWHLDQPARKVVPVALWLVRQLCQGLSALHRRGWVLGDVKPENVVVAANGHATLIDLAFAHRGTISPGGAFRGTPEYAAPERLSDAPVSSPAGDLFATGRLLWQWLSRIQTSDESMLRPIVEWVERMVAEDPVERPTADEVVAALLRLEIDTLGEHIVPPRPRRAA